MKGFDIMEFEEKMKVFSSKVNEKIEHIDCEETTKTALILPLLREMGYDTTDPLEVKMEYTADMGAKKGEKIDIAILDNSHELILIECKSVNSQLEKGNVSQLYRYFNITDSEIGILTNGVVYQFFTDSIKKGQMDKSPFLEIDMRDLSKKDILELSKFTKKNFDITKIRSKVDDLKFAHDVNKIIKLEIDSPSNEFIKVIAKQVYSGVITNKLRNKFKKMIRQEFERIINEKVEDKLNEALGKTNSFDDDIVTTKEEYEGYYIVKSILSRVIASDRINMKDVKSYCNVLLDNNSSYPIIRLYFNNPHNLKIGIFDDFEKRNSKRKTFSFHNINSVEDIYDYEEEIVKALNIYLRELKKKKK